MARYVFPHAPQSRLSAMRPSLSASSLPDSPISHDAEPRLGRGVYSTTVQGCPFWFLERSDGVRYGFFLPEGMPEHEILARMYVRLAADDPQRLKLLA